MPRMSNIADIRKTYVRVPRAARLALKNVLTRVAEAGLTAADGGEVTQERLVAASWLWMRDLPDAMLIQVIEKYLSRVEEIVEGGKDPGGFDGGVPPGMSLAYGADDEGSGPRHGSAAPKVTDTPPKHESPRQRRRRAKKA